MVSRRAPRAFLFADWSGLLAILAALVAGYLVLACAERRIGGYTGDILGAAGIAAELGAFAVLLGGLT